MHELCSMILTQRAYVIMPVAGNGGETVLEFIKKFHSLKTDIGSH